MINYLLITKPGIILGNLVTVAGGFLLASKGEFNSFLFLVTLLGLGFIIASACVFNNYIDRAIDKKMERTKNRPLVQGKISPTSALVFATLLAMIGTVLLWKFTNPLTVAVAAVGFFVYVLLYSIWKRDTIYSTAIGSISGAVPPVVGYCAVSNQFDLGAWIFFAIMVLWQMPHFFAIAISHLADYSRAEVPVLPVMKGVLRTKIHMALYILAFIPVMLLLPFFNYTGNIYLLVTLTLSLAWLGLALIGFRSHDDQYWAKQMFRLSLVMIAAICFTIPLGS